MVTIQTTMHTFYNQTEYYKYNIWNSIQVEIIIGVASIICMLCICIILVEKFILYRESIRDQIVNPINII